MRVFVFAVLWLVQGCGATDRQAADAGDAGLRGDAGSRDAAVAPPLPELAFPILPDTAACQLRGTRPDALPHLQVEPALAGATLGPARVLSASTDEPDTLYAAGIDGRIWRVSLGDPAVAVVVVDLRSQVGADASGDAGVRDLVLAQDFAVSGALFVSYVTPAPHRLVVLRLTLDGPRAGELVGQRRVVLSHLLPGTDAAGGGLALTTTGLLFIGVGDGGVAPDRDNPAQQLGLWGGKVLRVDVAQLDVDGGYGIPADNPIDAQHPVPSEVFAMGLRNPIACAWLAGMEAPLCVDRGVRTSEVNLITGAADYGWPVVDGADCVDAERECNPFDFTGSLIRLRHDERACGAVGGVFYTHDAIPELKGTFLYADGCSGRLYGLRDGPSGWRRDRVGAVGGPVVGLGTDAQGGLYASRPDGSLVRFTLADDGMPGTFPARISETGCFSDVAAQVPAVGLLPFDVATPLWTDGAHKRRFAALPPGAGIEFAADGAWRYPEGAILVKEFAYDFRVGDGVVRRPVETRFMRMRNGTWDFHSYRWDDAATDAELVLRGETVVYDVVTPSGDASVAYAFPDAASCTICHGTAPDGALGPRTDQLNHDVRYSGVGVRSQLSTWLELGLLVGPELDALDAPGSLRSLPNPADPTLPIQDRARSYLHANCAHCHRPGGWTSASLMLDLRYGTPFTDARLCGEPVQFGRTDRLRLAPGSPDDSHLLARMRDTGLQRMPPLATSVVDVEGTAVVEAWIESLTDGCPE